MRRFVLLLVATAITTAGCSPPLAQPPTDSAPPPAAHPPSPSRSQPSNSAVPAEATTRETAASNGPLQVDLPEEPTSIPNEAAGAYAGPDEPINYTEAFHDHSDHTFSGPLPWPDAPPVDAPPLLVAEFVTAVITNTSPDQPMDPSVIAPWLVPELAAQFRLASARANTRASTAAELVQSTLVDGTQTAHQAEVHLLFEQQTAAHGPIGFVHVEALLVLDTDSRWVIADLRMASK